MKTLSRVLTVLLLAFVSLLALPSSAEANVHVGIGVGGPGYSGRGPGYYPDRYWVSGHWAYRRGDRFWVPGYWVETDQGPYYGGYGGPSIFIGGYGGHGGHGGYRGGHGGGHHH